MSSALSFVVYDNRSGSTLLSALLNRHRGVVVSHETDLVDQIMQYRRPVRSRDDVEELLQFLRAHSRFDELGIDNDGLLDAVCALRTNRDSVLRVLLSKYFQSIDSHARHCIVKGPGIYYHLDRLRATYPNARLIHVIRDGRAVYASKLRSVSTSGRAMTSNVFQSAEVWRAHVRLIDRSPIPVHTVRYEDLVRRPDEEISRVLDFLGVAGPDRETTKSQEEFALRVGKQYQHLHPNLGRPPTPQNADRWTEELDPADIRLYEMLNRTQLVQFGYPISVGRAPLMRVGHAMLRHLWRHAMAKGGALRRVSGRPSLLNQKIRRGLARFWISIASNE